ncbi:hypothetical protein JTB14_015050 [Gonioctena quinquepunctata]|nr:hypothetical protein JTB14_015050 [Gonioctena quinquepunctata]
MHESMDVDLDENMEDVEEINSELDIWYKEVMNISRFNFTGVFGLQADIHFTGQSMKPFDVFKSIVDEDVMNLIVLETNRYANQLLNSKQLSL